MLNKFKELFKRSDKQDKQWVDYLIRVRFEQLRLERVEYETAKLQIKVSPKARIDEDMLEDMLHEIGFCDVLIDDWAQIEPAPKMDGIVSDAQAVIDEYVKTLKMLDEGFGYGKKE